jgi:hypothetical protein
MTTMRLTAPLFLSITAIAVPACMADADPDPDRQELRDPVAQDDNQVGTPELAAFPNLLEYFGGKVIPNVKVHNINWNSSVNPQVQPKLDAFYRFVLNSPYMDWLSEYNTMGIPGGSNQTIGRGGEGALVTLTPSTSSTSLTDATIQSEITSQINAGHLPSPDDNTVYAINFPANIGITDAFGNPSCGFCSYNSVFKRGTQNVYYAVLPSLEPNTACGRVEGKRRHCGPATDFLNNTTAVASSAIFNAVTDPERRFVPPGAVSAPMGWVHWSGDDSGAVFVDDIGNLCTFVQADVIGSDGKTYKVQKQYDNVTGNCIVSKP